ncbi:MAG: ribulose-phosphate 3-epimerase [Leptospirales bacterium]
MKIAPSILAAPMTSLQETLKKLDPEVVDYLHLDVMDGHFVPQISFGEAICKEIAGISKIPLDVHLMVSNPGVEVPKYFKLGDVKPEFITFHYETTDFPIRLAQTIRDAGIKPGLAINPVTPVEELENLYPYFDMFLIMSIEPGFYGQSFLPNALERLQKFNELRKVCSKKYNHFAELQVDGGVSDKNIEALKEVGVDISVAGSFVFKSENPNERVQSLK